MSIRYIKILLVVFASLLCLSYATQNVANLDAAFAAVGYVMGMQDHVVYPASFMPAVQSPALVWAALALVIALEFTAGLLIAKGAFDMWSVRRGDAVAFDAAKRLALVGTGVGMLVWMGLFGVVGGAVFQMWQTPAGAASLEGAFQFFGSMALVALFIALPEPRTPTI